MSAGAATCAQRWFVNITHALQKSYFKILFSHFFKDELEECGGPFGSSGTCKFGHFCFKHCFRNPKFAGDRCTQSFRRQDEGICVSAEEKENIEESMYIKPNLKPNSLELCFSSFADHEPNIVYRFEKGTHKFREIDFCDVEPPPPTLPPPPPPPAKKMYLLVNVPDK